MERKEKNYNLKKNKGFSLVEAMLSLLVVGTIVGIGYKIHNDTYKRERLEIAAEAISNNEDMATKFIMENNTQIITNMKKEHPQRNYYASSIVNLKSVIPTYKMDINNFYSLPTQMYSTPCVIISRDASNQVLKGYLFWNNIAKPNKEIFDQQSLQYLMANKKEAELVSSSSSVLNQRVSPNSPDSIKTALSSCGINSIGNNSIFLDLSKNPDYLRVRDLATDGSSNKDLNKTSDSLTSKEGTENTSNQTLTTNLYFDTVVKEKSNYTNYFCDNARASNDFAQQIRQKCVDFENSSGNYFVGGQVISGNGKVDTQCDYMIDGIFSGRTIYQDRWGRTITELKQDGAPDIANGCKWQYNTGNPGVLDETKVVYYCSLPFDLANRLNPNRSCKIGETWDCPVQGNIVKYSVCQDDTSGRRNSYIQNGCVKYSEWSHGTEIQGVCPAEYLSQGAYQQYTSNIVCKVGDGSSQKLPCGKITVNAYSEQREAPPEHKYQSLKVGDVASISSGSTTGASMSGDTDVKYENTNLKSGYIMIRSQTGITMHTSCSANDLGKTYQETNVSDKKVGSQLICSYNKDFCDGNGYCYLPLVSEEKIVLGGAVNTLSCPPTYKLNMVLPIYSSNGKEIGAECLIKTPTSVTRKTTRITPSSPEICGIKYGSGIREIVCSNSSSGKEYNNCKFNGSNVVCN